MRNLSLLPLLLLPTIPAFAVLGERIQIAYDSPIPTGWALVAISGHGRLGSGVSVGRTIMDLNGAPYGYQVQVLGESQVPDGWVVISNQASGYAVYKTIRCLNGSPAPSSGAGAGRHQIIADSPIPKGWRVVRALKLVSPGDPTQEIELSEP